ncbi:RecX family transcriptional regulator [Candidatus Woesebacteria bacterium]|nr:RecX family transcriptional regulator [Candidatus Woesebacteria bacterium]
MPTITSIKPQKNQKRVNVYLDDKFGFGLDLENFVKFDLQVGKLLSENEVSEIIRKSDFGKIYENLLRFVTRRLRSEKEINNWFRKKEVGSNLRDNLLIQLKKLELVDDEKFAKWWINQRTEFKPSGKLKIKKELFQKGISSKLIDRLLGEMLSTDEQVASAKKILEKRLPRWKILSFDERYKKAFGFLASRGFDYEIIKRIFDDLGIKRYNSGGDSDD